LIEHVEHHDVLFKEVARVLKPTGHFVCTTPNILSLKSRLRFFTTGYFYSFDTLDPAKRDPVSQHITPFTLDRYVWRFAQCGLRIERVSTDKHQRSSLALGFLVPLIRWAARASQGDSPSVRLQNSRAALFGRKLMIVATRIQ
jgi:SAM-dependent methyltransferase